MDNVQKDETVSILCKAQKKKNRTITYLPQLVVISFFLLSSLFFCDKFLKQKYKPLKQKKKTTLLGL